MAKLHYDPEILKVTFKEIGDITGGQFTAKAFQRNDVLNLFKARTGREVKAGSLYGLWAKKFKEGAPATKNKVIGLPFLVFVGDAMHGFESAEEVENAIKNSSLNLGSAPFTVYAKQDVKIEMKVNWNKG